MRSQIVLSKAQVASLVAFAALAGGLIAGGTLTLAAGDGGPDSDAPNTVHICVDAGNYGMHFSAEGESCPAEGATRIGLKTPLTGAQANALANDIQAERSKLQKFGAELDSFEELADRDNLSVEKSADLMSKLYTAVSNIMKSKHDTVKNSIQNLK